MPIKIDRKLGKKERKGKSYSKRTKKVQKVAIVEPSSMKLINSSARSPFGQKHTSNFRYCQQIAISSGVTCGVHSFRLNSMFDPDFTGTGHQPLFRDVFSDLYARYRVNSVKYRITILNNTYLYLMGVLATQDTSYNPATKQFQQIIEKRNVNWVPSLINNEPKRIEGKVYCHTVAGVTRQAYRDERSYSGAVGSNPTLELFLTLFGQDVGSATRNTDVMVELEFNTTYYEPKVQLQN